MSSETIVGGVLVTGFVLFMVGAGAWRIAYEQPPETSLPVIHADRRRRAWIHVWMTAGVFATTAGLAALAILLTPGTAGVAAALAAAVYALGALCWIVSLAFRLTVVPWAAEHTAAHATPPDSFAPVNAWAGVLYVIHMAAAYAAFALLGAAVLATADLPGWLGWLGVGWGLVFLVGFVLTRFAGLFNPPFWAHCYTAVIGIVLLL